ncbi:MAG: (2Fe-2S) ferredoxin domain-containing protein [Candidatus Omnitrophota bacterium]|nr:MAG: (2Fe-2S) ferredoxin domain-containing protein [Candidatus Omnitrophota bacterium]
MTKLTLKNFDQETSKEEKEIKNWVKVGMSTCGIAAGADVVMETIKKAVKENGLDIKVIKTGCVGKCYAEPLVEVKVENMPQVMYGKVDADIANLIIQQHIIGKKLLNDCIYLVAVKDGKNG